MPDPEHQLGADSQASVNGCLRPTSPLLTETPLPLPDLCSAIHGRITSFLADDTSSRHQRRVQEQTRTALGVIEDALERYSLSELSISYNGGKDCLVLLILYLAALHTKCFSKFPQSDPTIQSVYIVASHPFPEVEDFVASSSKTYCLSLSHYAKPMKAAFQDYIDEHPSVKAIFVGTRRTDPHGEFLTHFDPTDHGWPSFMRVHPVIDWHYVDIWTFIRHLGIPYCPLYDQGYTSLGGTTDTHRNPALRRNSTSAQGKPETEFRPAYELVEDLEERLGRDWETRQAVAQAGDAKDRSKN